MKLGWARDGFTDDPQGKPIGKVHSKQIEHTFILPFSSVPIRDHNLAPLVVPRGKPS